MNDALFRREVMTARSDAGLGRVRIVQPVGLWLVTALLVSLCAASLAYLWWGEATRKVRVEGVLAPDLGLIPLASNQAATVRERPVRQGQSVRAGEVLFVLDLPETVSVGAAQQDIQRTIESRERSLRAALRDQTLLDNETLAGRRARLADLQREAAQIEAELAIQEQRLALAEQNLKRFEALSNQQFAAPALVQARADEALALRAQVQSLQRQRAAQARAMSDVQSEIRELPLRSSARQGEIERELAQLGESAARNAPREAIRQWVIRAPTDATVAAVLADVGQSVGEAQVLARLVPAAARLQAQLYVPSSAVGFVQPGQTVAMRVHAFVHERFGAAHGEVLAVSQAPVGAADGAPEGGRLSSDPMYRVTVSLPQQQIEFKGRRWPLIAGMQLDADVHLERRRLIEWLFAPLLAGSSRL